jgi:hypothetical protein
LAALRLVRLLRLPKWLVYYVQYTTLIIFKRWFNQLGPRLMKQMLLIRIPLSLLCGHAKNKKIKGNANYVAAIKYDQLNADHFWGVSVTLILQ